jgi:hypothetical protein
MSSGRLVAVGSIIVQRKTAITVHNSVAVDAMPK